MRALLSAVLVVLLGASALVAQDGLEAAFRKPAAVEPGMVGDILPDTPTADADKGYDPVHAALTPNRPAAYLVTPGTTPKDMRGIVLASAATGTMATFGSQLAGGAPVTSQPYWEHAKGLATVRARVLGITGSGARQTTAAVLTPWADVREATDGEKRALGQVLGHLTSLQIGYEVITGDELAEGVTGAKVVFLPQVTLTSGAQVEAIKKLVGDGVKVIATHDLPLGPEGDAAWVEEVFGAASIDDIEEPVLEKGNAVVCPAELNRLNPMLNGMRCEDLFLYPPWRRAVSGHFVADDGETDWYLLYNSGNAAVHTYLTLYRLCAPEIWEIDTGATRPAPGYKHTEDGTTLVPLVLQPEDAVVLMCKPPLRKEADRHITQAPGLERVEATERDGKVVVTGLARLNGTHTVMLADGRKGKEKVEGLPPRLIVDGGWAFGTATAFDRQPSRIERARVREEGPDDDTSAWAAPDFDDVVWNTGIIGEDLPALAPKWHARWLKADGHQAMHFFRKAVELEGKPASARITVTADNEYEVYVNGEKVGEDGTWMQAETYNVSERLKPGKNVIAIRVLNDGPVGALMAEGRVVSGDGTAVRVVTDESWLTTQEAPEGWEAPGFDDSAWQKPADAGAGGSTAPWGNVPGRPAEPEAGARVWLRFDLPPGATKLRASGAKVVAAYGDGEAASAEGEVVNFGKGDGGSRRAAIVIDGGAPPKGPFECEGDLGMILVGDWKVRGLAGYAGEATYERTLTLPQEYTKERLVLDLGQVGAIARVVVNGKDLGPRSRPPYVFDLGRVRKAKLKLKVTVANTLASADAQTDAPAGIVGPIVLRPYREVEVEL